MQNHQDLDSTENHPNVVQSLLDEQFSRILINLSQQQEQNATRGRISSSNSITNERKVTNNLEASRSDLGGRNSRRTLTLITPSNNEGSLEQSSTFGSSSVDTLTPSPPSSSFSSTQEIRAPLESPVNLLTNRMTNSSIVSPANSNNPLRTSLAPTSDDNTYILDLSRPGESADLRLQNRFEVLRSDPNNHHLPSCVRGSSKTWKTRKSSTSSTTTAKLKSDGKADHICNGKCCRPLYVLSASPTTSMSEEAVCKFRGQPGRHQNVVIVDQRHSSISVSSKSTKSPRESGASSCSIDETGSSDMVAGIAGRCPDCGRCKCARCVEDSPVSCCGGNVNDDCCVDVMSCMCCVKGIASFFATNTGKVAGSSSRRQQSGRNTRHISQLPTPTGSISPNKMYPDTDEEDETGGGCCGLASSNPCLCKGPARQRAFRFTCLTVLSLFIPCLACYLPCRVAGAGVRWCYNRSRAPNACVCPRSKSKTGSHQQVPNDHIQRQREGHHHPHQAHRKGNRSPATSAVLQGRECSHTQRSLNDGAGCSNNTTTSRSNTKRW